MAAGRTASLRHGWPVALIVLVAAAWAMRWALSVDSWRVMTDELLYVKSALSMWDGPALRPSIRGQLSGNYGVLWPGLLAPLMGLFDVPTAFRLGHALGALLMASAAVPAYLLGVFVTRSRPVGWAAAALVAFVPWVTLSMNLLTEAVAYPVFVWALLASVVAVAEPSWRRDVLVLAAFGLAFVARTQFIFLFALLPLLVAGHEVGIRLAGRSPRAWAGQAWGGLKASVTGHKVLTVVVALGALVALLAWDRIPLGDYTTVRSAGLFPAGYWGEALDHLTQIAFGVAVIPMILALAYVADQVVGGGRRAQALAVHVAVVGAAVVAVATTFDITFSGGSVQERYVFYVVPLLMIAAACFPAVARRPLISVPLAAVPVALALASEGFVPGPDAAPYGSPSRLGWTSLDFRVDQLLPGDVGNGVALALLGVVAAAVVVVLVRSGRRQAALAGVTVGVVAWSVALTAYIGPILRGEHDGFAVSALGKVPAQDQRDWVDAEVGDAQVGLVPSAVNARAGEPVPPGTVTDQGVWWEAEFWNKAVTTSYLFEGAADYTPYTTQAMTLDRRTGALGGTAYEAPFLLMANTNVRLGIAGRPVETGPDLTLLRPDRPYRAAWATTGVDDRGGLGAAKGGARVTVYGRHAAGRRSYTVALALSGRSRRPVSVQGDGVARQVPVAGRRLVGATVCVPARGARPVRLDGNLAKVRLLSVRVRPGGPC